MKYYALWLVLFCVIVFILQLIFPSLTENFMLTKDLSSRPWILLTSIFLHADIMHLAYNMLALFLFGLILEKITESRRFLLVFFAAGIFSSIISGISYESSLGASGAIFGVLGCLATLRPKMMVWVYGFPLPMFLAAVVWMLIDLFGIFYPSNIANAAHIAGLFAGILLGLLMRKQFTEKAERKKPLSKHELDRWEKDYMGL